MSSASERPKNARRFWCPGNVARHKGRAVQIVRLEVRAVVRDLSSGKLRTAKLRDIYESMAGKVLEETIE